MIYVPLPPILQKEAFGPKRQSMIYILQEREIIDCDLLWFNLMAWFKFMIYLV